MNTTQRNDHAAEPVRFILSAYLDEALRSATYDRLGDGTYGGRIPRCPDVIAFGAILQECEDELRSTLEDWIRVGLRLGHHLPVLAGIDLNGAPGRVPLAEWNRL